MLAEVCRVSLTLARYLCAILLLTCMDVESNPGPQDDNLLQFVDWRFNQVMQCLQMLYSNLSANMDSRFKTLESTIQRFSAEVNELKDCVHGCEEEIVDLKEDKEIIFERLQKLEDKIDETEQEMKRCSVKFFGVEELRKDDPLESVQQIVDILNYFSPHVTWNDADISRAVRLGNRQQNRDPRPLLVQFCRWSDKMAILSDKSLRDELRGNGIRVTSDLTSKQRDMVAFHRRQGQVAYYYNGRLFVNGRQSQQPRQSYRDHHQNADECWDQSASRVDHPIQRSQDRLWDEWKFNEPSRETVYNRGGPNGNHSKHYNEDQQQYKHRNKPDMSTREDKDYREHQYRHFHHKPGSKRYVEDERQNVYRHYSSTTTTTANRDNDYQVDQDYLDYQRDQPRQQQSSQQGVSRQQLSGRGHSAVNNSDVESRSSNYTRRPYKVDSSRSTGSKPIVPGIYSYSQVVQNNNPSGLRRREEHIRLVKLKNQDSKTRKHMPPSETVPEGIAGATPGSRRTDNRREEGAVHLMDHAMPAPRDDPVNHSEGGECDQETAVTGEPGGSRRTDNRREEGPVHLMDHAMPAPRDDPVNHSEGGECDQETAVAGEPAENTGDVAGSDTETQCDQISVNNDLLTDKRMTDDDSVLEQSIVINTNACSERQTETEATTENTTPNTDRQTDEHTVDCQEASVSSQVILEKLPQKSKTKTTKSGVASPLQPAAQGKGATPKTRTRSQTITDSFKRVPSSKGTSDKEGAMNTRTKSSNQ